MVRKNGEAKVEGKSGKMKSKKKEYTGRERRWRVERKRGKREKHRREGEGEEEGWNKGKGVVKLD